ncbi:MAG: tryptophan 7-halogenase [Planctomycetia bacterium]|nr:tryptophan 7-halogenase [Planctomycetia bacterium]
MIQSNMNDNYDCLVLGGGPAGSTAAALVAEAGFSTLLVERDKFPRFHIGESLIPESYWTLKRLGLLERMKESAFTKKYSVQFVSGEGRTSVPFYFNQHDPRECSQTWQVLRSEFDQMLFENAADQGATCRQETRVQEVLFDGPRAVGVRLTGPDGHSRSIASKVIIDATGQQSVIGTRLGVRKIHPRLKKMAVWTYYRGAARLPGIDGGATLVLRTLNRNGWFWYIPLHNDITSVGVVGDVEYMTANRGKPEEVFAEEVALCPGLQERLVGAEQVEPIRIAREFSYTSQCPAGDGWVLAGDAFTFIDPLYSSGVLLALKSGELSADAVIDGLRSGDTSAAQLGRWAPEFEKGVACIRKLVEAYYSNCFSFGEFLKEFPQHRGAITDILIGRVFHPTATDVFRDMDPWLPEWLRGV